MSKFRQQIKEKILNGRVENIPDPPYIASLAADIKNRVNHVWNLLKHGDPHIVIYSARLAVKDVAVHLYNDRIYKVFSFCNTTNNINTTNLVVDVHFTDIATDLAHFIRTII